MKNLLIIVYTVFITFLVGSAVFASRTFDGDIENSYEKGMQYPKDIALIKELGWKISTPNSLVKAKKSSEINLVIKNRNGLPVKGAKVSLEVSRLTTPTTLPPLSAFDNQDGLYLATATLPNSGHWQVIAQIDHHGSNIQHTFNIYAEE